MEKDRTKQLDENLRGLEPKDQATLIQSQEAWDAMKNSKKNKLDIGSVNSDYIAKRKRDSKQGRKGSEKVYYYTPYKWSDGVVLYCLKKEGEQAYGYKFIVEYIPMNWFFGFNDWNDADQFARSQANRFNGLNRMLGG